MFATIIIAALIASAVCQQCGISHFPSTNSTQIFGKATKGEFPWVVSITFISPFHFYNCSGAIIDETTIVTVGVCGDGFNPEQLQVIAGVVDLRENEETEQKVEVLKITVHEDYNYFLGIYDIAILKLKTPLKFNEYVQPICLPEHFEEYSGACIAAGWTPGNSYSPLYKLSVYPISDAVCRAKQHVTTIRIPDHVLCTGTEDRYSHVCRKQQGSPLMCQNQNGQYVLAGLFIWGCVLPPEPFAVNTQISHFVNWIQNRM